MTRVYTPPRTIGQYMLSRQRVQLLLGPIGGGKTTGVLMKLLFLAHSQQPNSYGVRKTRWAVVRNTRPQLRDSVLKSVFDWLPPNGRSIRWHETDMDLVLDLPLADDTRVECEIMFRALDDERDARRLLSVEYTGVWLSEFREIPHQLLTDALSRTGRYPSASDGGCSWHGVLGETNMPTKGSDWYRYIELERPSYCERFIQPSGISPQAENLNHLPEDYYTVLMEGAKANWVQAHILCEYPDSLDGKAVHSATYDHERHVSKIPFNAIGSGPTAPTILMGVDQGRSPAAVFAQMHPDGTCYVLREAYESNMGMEKFAEKVLRPIVNQHYTGMRILAVIDPAGTRKNEVNDDTPADALRRHGFMVVAAPTNDPKRRIDAVDRLLLQHKGMVINPECKVLINALAADYRFKTKKNGELEDVPEKKHPVSDLADALQYLCLVAGGDNYGRIVNRVNRGNRTAEAPPPVRGWT